MNNISKLAPLISPENEALTIAQKEKRLRKRAGLTQNQLASRAGISLACLRRFEQTGQIQFVALIRVMRALNCSSELKALFEKPAYRNIQEVINEQN